jgi:16S rRNA (cytosine967-C5)-methyltransferase
MSRHVKPSLNPRVIAFHALETIAQRATAGAGDVLADTFARLPGLDVRDRALATELVQGVLRWQLVLDARLGPLVNQGLAKIEREAAVWLRLGAYQTAFLGRIPRSIAVSATIDALKSSGSARLAGLVNAVLRRFVAGLPMIADPTSDDPTELALALAGIGPDTPPTVETVAACAGLPEWIAAEMVATWGADALREALALRRRAGVTLRPTVGRGGTDALLAALGKAGLEGRPIAEGPGRGLVELAEGDVFRTAAWFEGLCVAQDVSSHAVVRRLMDTWNSTHPGGPAPRVLDLCAGRGIKATALADMGAEVVAVDVGPAKLETLKGLARRLGVEDRIRATIATDATRPDSAVAAHGPYDVVLVDAPCSGLGTIRRHPEIVFRRQPGDIASLVAIQRALVERATELVRPGGAIVYAVCSFVRAEGDVPVPSGFACVDAGAERPTSGGDAFVFKRFEDRRHG